jgi:tetratricopeptide (TPR) repeat protein
MVAERFAHAVRCQQSGRLVEAVALYDQVVVLNPGIAEVHNNRGAALAGLEKFADAEGAYRRAIALKPDYAEAFNNLGNALCQTGKLDEAERALRSAIRLSPRWARCRTNLGLVLKCRGRFGDAEAAHREAIALEPELAEAYNNLGVTLCAVGRLDEAEDSLRHAIRLNPRYADAYVNLAIALKAQGKSAAAEAACRQAISLDAMSAYAYNVLGNVQLDLGRAHEAERSLRHALTLRPRFAEALSNLGHTLVGLGRLDEAEVAFRQAIAFKPDIAAAHYNLGYVLERQDRLADAEAAYRQAIVLKPDFADAHNNLGATLKFLGRFTDARACVERALQLSPQNPSYLLSLAELKRFDRGDADLASLQALARDFAALPVKKQIDLSFALAKACEDIGRCDEAIHHLLAGNALKRRQISYDEAAALGGLDDIVESFTPELMRSLEGAGESSSAPVFIVGMPRSGTTLIEQILASHPDTFGGGELPTLSAIAAGIMPNKAVHISADSLRRAGARYVAEIARLAPHAARITDKMPSNFRFAGLIHLMLPNARIIHAVRNPLDTCFSCFSKLFADGQYQTYDLAELGRYYRRYQRVMEHWRRLLPAGRILEVRYEDVVTDLEGQARRIIAHCGLAWHDRCLAFHETDRPVHTASALQVRQPLYEHAIGRARPFIRFLQPLIDAISVDDKGEDPCCIVNSAVM